MRPAGAFELGELAEEVEVVENPEAATVTGDGHFVALHCEVVDGDAGKVGREMVPAIAVVSREVDRGLGAGVYEAGLFRVFLQDAGEVVNRNAIDDRRPGLPVVGGPEEIGTGVVETVAGGTDIGYGGVMT